MSKFTQGEWTGAGADGKFNANHEWRTEDEAACVSEAAPIWANGKVIALVVSSDSSGKFSEEELLANARLMVAAPKMLAALQMALRQNDHDMLMTGEELRICEAAIANATGEKS